MSPSLFLRSIISEDKQSIAITSVATVITNPSSLGTPCVFPPRPTTILRSSLSFISKHLFTKIWWESIFKEFP